MRAVDAFVVGCCYPVIKNLFSFFNVQVKLKSTALKPSETLFSSAKVSISKETQK